MALIQIKNRILPSLSVMHDIALRYIFDKNSVEYLEQISLEEGIDGWSKKIGLNPSERWELRRIINALIANEHGHFNRAKELIRQHEVDYNKMYSAGLPYITIEGRKFWNKS